MPRAFVAPEETVVMSKIRTPRLPHLIAALFCAGASLPVLPADGHGHDAKPAAAKKAVAEAPAASAAETKPAKPAARAEPPQDPMDKLRERLAEKLGATKAAPSNPNVVRVAARASAEPEHAPAAATAAAHAARPAAPKARAVVSHDAPAGHAAHWSYEGAGGPSGWGAMKPEFAKCSTGTRQSPIDIREGIKVQLDPVQFDYRPSGFRVIDNGHTVQVNVAAGNSIEVMGRRYDLLQFHFHRPSEERIDGKQFDMVAHLVHKDAEGRLAVVAVLLDRGSAQPIVQTVWNNLPLEKGDEVPAKGSLDLNALLPPERSYFTYMGSLTTPPCSEGVLWMVMKQPVSISQEQIAIFSRLYPMNARPIQSASGRLIKESN
ncbi:carbonic anhydrase [Rhizobacter sp. AJA081-3]|uniref:carbonic anhydrase n=1 Tax=Rhizobacter sp. AJA081-3 TaxID=2753607 RepID=UPI0035300755